MKNNSIYRYITLLVVAGCILIMPSCSSDTPPQVPEETIVDKDSIPEKPQDPAEVELDFVPEGTVQVFNEEKVDPSYILVNDAASNRVFIMDKEARLLHEWDLTNNIGNDVFLLPNGKLLASLESDDPQIKLGGKGGRLQLVEPDGTLDWDFIYSSTEAETHHDVEMLPNGNVIALVWGRRSEEEAVNMGSMLDSDVFVESVIEVNTTTSEIVWEWHSWDHLIQDHDPTKPGYGTISDHPERIDLNYVTKSETPVEVKGNLMHANGIAYDEVNDVILVSANLFSEIWAIDHSTSTEEAATSSGGNYGKGGDLIYRFGNPEAYENPSGTRMFHNNHFPNLLKGDSLGKLLVFSNGNNVGQSTVFEFELPAVYSLQANANNELKVTWSFTDPALHSPKVSGAVPLPNGNILITEGDFGYWEVTREKEVVWKFNAPGFFWRGYSYPQDAPEIKLLGL